MNHNRLWIIIGIAGIVLFFAFFIMLLWYFGYFDFTGSEASAKIVASALALIGGLIGSLVTIIGVFLKNSLDQRNANLKEEAESRLKLEAAIQAVKLLSTESGKDAPLSQRAGVLFTLSHLGLSDLAITMLNEMLPNDRIDSSTAAWLINHVLKSNLGDLSIEATGLLNDNYEKFLTANGKYDFPRCLNLKWNTILPKLARRNAALALLRMTIKRRPNEWSFDSLNAVIATLIFIWKDETDREIRNGVGLCLKTIIKLRAGYIIHLPTGKMIINKVKSELKEITSFPTTTGFVDISELIKKWIYCENNCPENGCESNCRKYGDHTGKHKCAKGHEW